MIQRLLVAMLVVIAAGCGTAVQFRVPLAEVQRQASLPQAERGNLVRVIPFDPSEVPPSLENGAAPAPVAAAPIDDDDSGVSVELQVQPGSGHVPDDHGRGRVFGHARMTGAPVHAAGGWRGPAPAAPRLAATHVASRLPAIHHGGGGGGGNGAAVIAGVAAGLILVAVLADVAADSGAHNQRADFARTFEGWTSVGRHQPLHVVYKNGRERTMPFAELSPSDTDGALYAYMDENDGPIVVLPPPTVVQQPPPPPPPPPPPATTGPPVPHLLPGGSA